MKGRKGSMESSRCKICLLSRIETGRCDRLRLRLRMAFSKTKQALFLKTSTLFLFYCRLAIGKLCPQTYQGEVSLATSTLTSLAQEINPSPSKTSLQAF